MSGSALGTAAAQAVPPMAQNYTRTVGQFGVPEGGVGGKPPRTPGGGKGGTAGQQPMQQAAPTQGQYAPLSGGMQQQRQGGGGKGGQMAPQPLAPQGNFNVNQAAAGGLQQAMMGTQAGMGFQPGQIQATSYRPMTGQAQGYQAAQAGSRGYGAERIGGASPIQEKAVQAGQIAGRDLSAYTNPYETQVVDQTLGDIERSRQMTQNQLGAQATASKAFGGSRQGIAEAETNRAYAQQAAQAATGLRQAGFQQAQQMAGQDISTQMQADLANQAQNLAAQSQTAGNVLAAQQANQAAQNMASQFGASASNAAAMQNAAAQNAARQFGAGAQNAMTGQNIGAINAARQFGATNQMSAQQQNIANQMAAQNMRLGAASQMGALGQQAFNTGQSIQQSQSQQGLLQQGMQQALIDAAKAQYAGYTGAPAASLSAPLAALGVVPNQSTTTTQSNPGLFSYLQMAAGIPGLSDVRLKESIEPVSSIGGVNFYTWDWNEKGKELAHPDQPTFGVIADELQETHPHLVQRLDDGYLRVDYNGLAAEISGQKVV